MVRGVEVGVADQPVLVSVHGDEAAPGLAPLHLVLHDAVAAAGCCTLLTPALNIGYMRDVLSEKVPHILSALF